MMMPPFILSWGSTHGILPYCEIHIERRYEKFIVFCGIQGNVSHGEKFPPCLGRIMIMSVCELGFFVRPSQGKTGISSPQPKVMMMPPFILPWGYTHVILLNCEIHLPWGSTHVLKTR